jgi:formylglycine-generating enzyme required for sulfatase activity
MKPRLALSFLALFTVLYCAGCAATGHHFFQNDAPHAVGAKFRDCRDCPEMTVLPAGSFTMGSPDDEDLRSAQEGPRHVVTIAHPFAIGIYHVTREQFAVFARETGRPKAKACIVFQDGGAKETEGADWSAPGFAQTGRDPVLCDDWDDVHDYIAWLNAKLGLTGGRAYRLPTEAEWEYADRAGTTTRFYWGDSAEIACRYGNTADESAKRAYPFLKTVACDDGFAATSPVGSFPPNGFGLYDMAGDVFDWIQDCWHPSYDGAPADGSAWTTGDCHEHVIRGGSLGHVPRLMRSAYRFKDPVEHRSVFLGFRLARDVE